MKSYLVAAMAISITACGGGSSSSSDKVEVTDAQNYIEASEEVCQGATVSTVEGDALVFDDEQNYRITPTGITDLVVKDSNSAVCVDGNLAAIEALGERHKILVSGNVSELSVVGSDMEIAIYGEATSINVTGSNNRIYFGSVATIADTGSGNAILNASHAKF